MCGLNPLADSHSSAVAIPPPPDTEVGESCKILVEAAIAQNQRNWKTAHENSRSEECDKFLKIGQQLFVRYKQLRGPHNQLGDIVDMDGNLKSTLHSTNVDCNEC